MRRKHPQHNPPPKTTRVPESIPDDGETCDQYVRGRQAETAIWLNLMFREDERREVKPATVH